MEMKTTAGMMMDIPTYNRLRSFEKFAESGPVGPRITVTLVCWEKQFGLVVPPSTTFRALAECAISLAGMDYDPAHLKCQDGSVYEPDWTLEMARVEDGAKLYAMFNKARTT